MISEQFPNWFNCERHSFDITNIFKGRLFIYKLIVAQLVIKLPFTLIEIDIVFVTVQRWSPFWVQYSQSEPPPPHVLQDHHSVSDT